MSKAWVAFHLDWLAFGGHLLIIRYEDLMKDMNSSLTRITEFLNLTLSGPHFDCVIRNSDGVFKRPKRKVIDYDPFSKAMRESIEIYKHTIALAIRARYVKPCNSTSVNGRTPSRASHQ